MTDAELLLLSAKGFRAYELEKSANIAAGARAGWGAVKGWLSRVASKSTAKAGAKDVANANLLTRLGRSAKKDPMAAAGATMMFPVLPGIGKNPLYMPMTGEAGAKHTQRAARNKAIQSYYQTGKQKRHPMTRLASDNRYEGLTKVAYDESTLRRAAQLRRSLEKTAAPGGIFANLMKSTPRKLFMLGAGLTAGTAAAQGGMTAIHQGMGAMGRALHGARETSAYNKMLKADPSLRSEPEARNYFGVVHRASPYISSEPIIAAATVRSMIESPLGAPDERRMQSVLGTETEYRKQRYPWAGGGQKAPGPRDIAAADDMLSGAVQNAAQMGMFT